MGEPACTLHVHVLCVLPVMVSSKRKKGEPTVAPSAVGAVSVQEALQVPPVSSTNRLLRCRTPERGSGTHCGDVHAPNATTHPFSGDGGHNLEITPLRALRRLVPEEAASSEETCAAVARSLANRSFRLQGQ